MCATKSSDKLDTYRAKRKASRTPEPFGGARAPGGQLFVVQHHAARATHYDLRLEMEGVLRSWAVPKGPSPNPADKRLAVRVEDHPLEYANFEGHIPEGNYGAGAVIVWDRGTWLPLGDPLAGLEEGKLLFELKGYKLRGKWTLVKTKRGEKDWLLIKERDSHVTEESTDALPADSILSGQTVEDLKEQRSPGRRLAAKLKRHRAAKRRVDAKKAGLMLAQSSETFSRPGWLFEIKYDGYRLKAVRDQGQVILYSRADNDLTAVFPEIAEALGRLPFDYLIVDGEAVVHDEHGLPSFSQLQKRGRLVNAVEIQRATLLLPASLYAFDLLAVDDFDLRALPLETRKSFLREILPSVGPVRYSDHIEEHGEAMYKQVSELGLEGVMAKKADSRYSAGRSGNWLKIRVEHTDDFVVIGFKDSKDTEGVLGSLALGVYADGSLIYVGRAGSGLGHHDLKSIYRQLKALRPADAPNNAPANEPIHWLEPKLVAEVKYMLVTPDGVLRQPVFLRLRDDKRPEECIRVERESEPPELELEAAPPPQKVVHFSNLEKTFWPAESYTKGDLIEYYRKIGPWLLPYLQDRPVVLTRYPDGIEGKSFFQKDAPSFAPDWIRIERMWSEHAEREVGYFIVEDIESLLYLANMGTIPLHIWSSRVRTLERPDWSILDLDPKGAPFGNVVKIAKRVRTLCNEIGLSSFAKTSGSTGLHVLIPLGQAYTYEQSRTLAELLARVVAAELPEIATVTRAVSGREGKVYLDYGQNGHGRLLVAPFSVRPLPGAPVSMPLRWREVTAKLDNSRFTIKNAVRRMTSLKEDPLTQAMTLKSDINTALARLADRF